jgi:hypothetical protein
MSGKINAKILLKFYEKTRHWCHKAVVEGYQKLQVNGIDYREFEEEDISKALYEEMVELPLVKEKQITIVPEFRLYGKKYSNKDANAKRSDRIDFRFSKWKQQKQLEYFGEAKNLSLNNWTKSSNSTPVNASYYRGRYIDTGIKHLLSGSYSLLTGFLIGYVVNGSANNNLEALNRLITKRKLQPAIGMIEQQKTIGGHFDCYSSENQMVGKSVGLDHIFLPFD